MFVLHVTNTHGAKICCCCLSFPRREIKVSDLSYVNLLKPNDIYIYIHTAALNSRRYILNIYSTNIHIEYFKHAA